MASYVYIIANGSRRIYIGVTNDIRRRVLEHRCGAGSSFAAQYSINRLVYFAEFTDIRLAIAEEKRLKGLRREKKVAIIEALNPTWNDLAPELWPDDMDIEIR